MSLQMSSPGLTGRSSIPEAVLLEPKSRGVLDTPHARGMTGECEATVAPSQLPCIGERKRTYSPRVLVEDQGPRYRRLGALAAVFPLAEPAVDADGCAFRLLQIHAGGIDEFRRMADLAAETNRKARLRLRVRRHRAAH